MVSALASSGRERMAHPSTHSQQTERAPGDQVAGRYVLKRKLGEGAAGVVWVARSTALDVDIALKMLRPELAGTGAVERMEREARTAAQLGHPALVRVLDFGVSDLKEPFLALELLEGEGLQARLAREQRLPAKEAIGLMLPIIDGLGTAHNKGIIHRDVKPENIFIASDQRGRVQPKMLDFGIAKLQESQNTRLTQAGAVVGSPYYLSPEQARGLDDLDFRTDIWSIGVVLYELITGAPPFVGNNYNALVASILRDAPQPFAGQGGADAALWTIVEVCLRKNREQRWASMWELGEALALWAFERGARTDAAARSLRHGWLSGATTGVEILLPSGAPDVPSLMPRARSGVAPATDRAPAAISAPPAPGELAAAPAKKRSAWLWGLAGTVALATGAAAWWLRPAASASPAPLLASPSAQASPSVSSPSVVSPSVVSPPVVSPAPVRPSEASAYVAPSAPPPSVKKAPPRRSVVKRAKPSHEFGF